MSQKHRPSLSQTAALYGQPGTITDQIAEARAKAREDIKAGIALDIEDAIKAAETIQTLRQLAAPPSAQKRRDKLKAKNGLTIPGGLFKRREARPPQRIEPTSAAPTPERIAKEPLPLKQQMHAGGQISHHPRVWTDEYGHRVPDKLQPALQLLLDAWEIASRVRMTSARAYTGAPYVGATDPDRVGHGNLTDQNRRDLQLFAYAMEHLTAQTPEWWDWLRVHILREPNTADGRIPSMEELGASFTGYKRKTDSARASGLTMLVLALLRWQECVQAGAMKLQHARMRRQAMHEEAVTLHVDERRVRLNGQRKEIEDKRKR